MVANGGGGNSGYSTQVSGVAIVWNGWNKRGSRGIPLWQVRSSAQPENLVPRSERRGMASAPWPTVKSIAQAKAMAVVEQGARLVENAAGSCMQFGLSRVPATASVA